MLDENWTASAGITRRQVFAGAASLGGAALLAACSSSASPANSPSGQASAAGKPVKGGKLIIGMDTAGTSETINPAKAVNLSDFLRIAQLYDLLFDVGSDVSTLVPKLALSAEHNSDATVWTLQLRDGVEWHDGKPFGADDVIWTLHTWANPANNAHGQVAGLIDYKSIRKRGNLTVEIPLLAPTAQFPSLLTFAEQVIIPDGATTTQLSSKPNGTGPFKFVSFTPGVQSVFVKNSSYWEHGRPYLDQLVCNSSFTDDEARNNALLSNSINVEPFLSPLIAKTTVSSNGVTLKKSPSVIQYFFIMRVDQGPFADVRIRQAMKLVADRPALIEGSLAGYGTVANDLMGVDTQYYASDLPQRVQDIDQAKFLLKAAGAEDFSVTLPTCNALPGFDPSATLLAEQAAKAGIHISVQQVPADTYYTAAGGFLKRPFCLDYGAPFQSLTEAYRTFFTASAPFNETHWGDQSGGAADWRLLNEAMAATDPTKASDLWGEVQRQQYDQGGFLVWANSDALTAVASNVHGVSESEAGYVNSFNFNDAWIG